MTRRRIFAISFLCIFITGGLFTACAFSENLKIGYVDFRKAFDEYERTKAFEKELDQMAEEKGAERDKKVEEVTRLRDEMELLGEEAKKKKQDEINNKLAELQEFDRSIRQEILTKRNDILRTVLDDVQKVVKEIGEKGKYDYILDSRSLIYSRDTFELTDEVIKRLNK